MLELTKTPTFGIILCIIAYLIGCRIKKSVKSPIANPMVIATLLVIGVLMLFKIPLENFMNGGSFITMLLAPATAVLSVSMYRQIEVIKRNWIPVLVGCTVGSTVCIACIVILCKLFNLPEDVTMSLLPKSITTAIATEISASIGGIVPLTVAGVCFTGVFGAIMCPYFIKWFKIDNPIAAGLGIGASCHVLGTSKAIEIGEIEGMMSGIAVGICGLVTVFILMFFGI